MRTYDYTPQLNEEKSNKAKQVGTNAAQLPAKDSGQQVQPMGHALLQQMKVNPNPSALGVAQFAFTHAVLHSKADFLKDEGDGKAGTGLLTKALISNMPAETELEVDFDALDSTKKYYKAKVQGNPGYVSSTAVYKKDAFGSLGDFSGDVDQEGPDKIEQTEKVLEPGLTGLEIDDKIAGAIERDHLKTVKDGKLQDKEGKSEKVEGHKNKMDIAAGVGGTVSGILGMASSVKAFNEAEDNWQKFEAGMEFAENTVGTGSGLAKIIDASAKSGGKEDGIGKSDVTGKVFEAVGASVSAVKDAVLGLHGVYQLVKGETDNSTKEGLAATQKLLKAAQSAAVVAKQAYDIIGKGIPTGVLATIPALGIAINAIDIIIRFNDRLKASGTMDDMGGKADALRGDVKTGLGGVQDDIFEDDKRGTFPWYQTFKRVPKSIQEGVEEALKEGSDNPTTAKAKVYAKVDSLSIPDSVKAAIKAKVKDDNKLDDLRALRDLVREYELADKLTEIAMKRKTNASNDIAADLINIVADIATLSGAGALAGAIMKSVVAGAKVAHSGAKAVQGLYRDQNETNKSSKNKHKEYVQHTKFIFQMTKNLESLGSTDTDDQKTAKIAKAGKVEKYISATGVNKSLLYSENGNPGKQAEMIVEALKKRK